MPNDNVPICGCGVTLDLPKNVRTGSGITKSNWGPSKNSSIVKTSWDNRSRNQRVAGEGAAAASAGAGTQVRETGSTSSVQLEKQKKSKQGKRLNSSRRTRSAERPETHYTYIDSGFSVVGNGIRDNVIPEALYSGINGSPNRTANPSSLVGSNNQQQTTTNNGQNNHPQPVYAVPSMTSPPPTYDAAMWQSGLPPSYEECLCHKYSVVSRSHTPPPPWSDSTLHGTPAGANNGNSSQSRRDILASQPELREYLIHLAKSHAQVQQAQCTNNNQTPSRHQRGSSSTVTSVPAQNLQISTREQAVRSQRARTTISRSQSESRARQQRIATMYEDGAFCMETTAIQSAFEHGVAFCSLM